MKASGSLPKYMVLFILVAGLGVWAWQYVGSKGNAVGVKVPALSTTAMNGKAAYDANCGTCHGLNASGSDKGPPLVHDLYNPGHHSDEAFFVAAKLGARRHHWPYGDMPPQPQVTDRQLMAIVQYVRELQRANGIGYRPH